MIRSNNRLFLKTQSDLKVHYVPCFVLVRKADDDPCWYGTQTRSILHSDTEEEEKRIYPEEKLIKTKKAYKEIIAKKKCLWLQTKKF